ncbi:hypothetical protein Pmani_018264 [Petrolisthes manimaculis]|uniref:Folylpolyglutamate synthase n=1 Tax=Petrolisthes manimaculis TaxID=1843537 RepID=A0AAE1PLT6_9EUCA|nr:hypothetical protein Pmani_018264 [Petrolisthes manimaculis]
MNTNARSDIDLQYEEAVQALNSLQTNAAELQRKRQDRASLIARNISGTESYLKKVGVSLGDLDKLSVIHVAGTKGKGSTCAFTESILREHGYRTGFYSSPHLVAVRERIRVNGQPISKEVFTRNFWDVYNKLLISKDSAEDMPAYFKFLTVLALKVFLREEVDVAILEVGIGGEYDCTNIVRKPVVCGISTLDFDHTSLLGSTIESITWHKAGIMKTNIPTFTLDQQLTTALMKLSDRAKEKECPLYVVPPLESYGWGARPLQLGMAGSVQYANASLALQLTQYWINYHTTGSNISYNKEKHSGPLSAEPFTLCDEEVIGLQSAVWPGRSQVMSCGDLTFFMDGAHTSKSMQGCVDWFTRTAPLHVPPSSSGQTYRVLIFNSTGDRDPETLLQFLPPCNIDLAIFTTNLVTTSMSASSDQTNYTISQDDMHLRCKRQRNIWISLVRKHSRSLNNEEVSNAPATSEETDKQLQNTEGEEHLDDKLPASDVPSIIFPCIKDALLWLSCGRNPNITGELLTPPAFPSPEALQEAAQVQVLVTGSLHLIGGILSIIDPGLSCTTRTRTPHKPPSLTDLVLRNYTKFSSPGAP